MRRDIYVENLTVYNTKYKMCLRVQALFNVIYNIHIPIYGLF